MQPNHFLFFSPGAHPTYIPLGLASLSGYAQLHAPDCNLQVVDLNIRFWQGLMNRGADPTLLRGFFRGEVGDFYSRNLSACYKGELDQLYRLMQELEEAVKEGLRQDAPFTIPELDALLNLSELAVPAPVRVAFSVLYPGQVAFTLYLARHLRERCPEAEIILGGAAMSALEIGELRRAAPWVDGILAGEGETPFVAWLKNEPIANCAPALALEHLPDPDFSFAPLGEYLMPETVLPVAFSRGCRWKRCRFCCHNASFRGYRTSAWNEFAKRLGRLQTRYRARFFYLTDQYVSAGDLEGISRAILAEGLDLRFHVMGRPVDEYTTEILALAHKAGCRWISWGVESFSARMLEVCDKGTTPGAIAGVLERASQEGISNLAMMIFGLPGSTEASLQETLDWAGRLHPHVDAFTSSQFQLFGGTPFFRHRSRYGLEVAGQEVLLQVGENPVHSLRYAYHAAGQEQSMAREIEVWERWKLFVRGGPSFYETLLCEHYLLHCTRARDSWQAPQAPQIPPRVAA